MNIVGNDAQYQCGDRIATHHCNRPRGSCSLQQSWKSYSLGDPEKQPKRSARARALAKVREIMQPGTSGDGVGEKGEKCEPIYGQISSYLELKIEWRCTGETPIWIYIDR